MVSYDTVRPMTITDRQGVLLTMAAVSGVDYLDKDLAKQLNYSKQKREENEDSSGMGFLWERFAKTGTRDWPEKTVEWLLTYILTEFAATPHTIRQGRNAITITSAYQAVVEQLVSTTEVLITLLTLT